MCPQGILPIPDQSIGFLAVVRCVPMPVLVRYSIYPAEGFSVPTFGPGNKTSRLPLEIRT